MRDLPEAKRKIRASKPKAGGPFTKGTGLESDLGRGIYFGVETYAVEVASRATGLRTAYRTREVREDRPFIPKVAPKAYGLPCAGCGISRPLAAREGEECEYCGTIYADTRGARIYVEG